MIAFSEAERPALLDWEKLRMDQCWRRGAIGDATYLRTLFNMGYVPRDAQTELNLLRLERPGSADAARAEKSRQWLESRR